MTERDIEIEFESEKISIEAVICFTRTTQNFYTTRLIEDWEYKYHPEYTQIKRIVDLELNEGAPPIPTTMAHYKMLEEYWERHDVYDEI